MSVVASAPGKLVLLGEYVVLENAPALVMAVARRAEITITAAPVFAVEAPTLGIEGLRFRVHNGAVVWPPDAGRAAHRLGFFAHVIETVVEYIGGRGGALPPCHARVVTDAFLQEGGQKLGIGSSAAMSVALLGGLLQWAGLPVADDETGRQLFFELASRAHARGQGGVGSGIDIAASIWGGVVRYQRDVRAGAAPMAVRQSAVDGLGMLPVWAGQSASTAPLVRTVQALKGGDPKRYWAAMEKLAIYATAGCEFWALRNVSAFLSAVDAYYEALLFLQEQSGAHIVTPTHRAIRDLVTAHGAVYKPSGAGGGDLGMAFGTPAALRKIAARLRRAGHKTVPLAVDPKGLVTIPKEL